MLEFSKFKNDYLFFFQGNDEYNDIEIPIDKTSILTPNH